MLKEERVLDNFSWGLNTRDPAHQLDPRELVKAEWTSGETRGLEKHKGLTEFADFGFTNIQGLGVFERKDGTEVIIVAHNGLIKNYYLGSWATIPIRLHPPHNVKVVQATSGAVGPHLSGATTYTYTIISYNGGNACSKVAFDVTTGATPHPITITANGTNGASTYKVYRTSGGVTSIIFEGLTHAYTLVAGMGETIVSFVDDGNAWVYSPTTLPEVGYPFGVAPNISVNFVQDTVNPDKVYFSNGSWLVEHDMNLNYATTVQPAPNDAVDGSNALHNFLSAERSITACNNFVIHNEYRFAMNNAFEPRNIYYSKLGRWDFWPGLAVLHSETNGKVHAAQRLYNVLGFATAGGVSTLHGKTFTVDSANFDGYWSAISTVGVSSARSWVKVPAFGRDILVGATEDKDIRGVFADTAVESYMNSRSLAEHIKPTLEGITDWANAAAVYWNKAYIISFPADKKIFIGYPDRRSDGGFAWYGPISGVGISCWAVRPDGTLLAGDSSSGIVYVWADGYAMPDGSAYTFRAKTGALDQVLKVKKLRKMYIRGKQQSTTSTCTARVYADYDVKEKTGIDLNSDGTSGAYVIGEDTLGENDANLTNTSLRTKGRKLSYEVENAVAGEPVTVYGFYELYSMKQPK